MNKQPASDERLHVVAAVIQGADRRFLLSQRLVHKHQGGKWEFPGGKVEPGESAGAALQRELLEELGIAVPESAMMHFMDVHYDYPDKKVHLDIWWVRGFSGDPKGLEHQKVAWFTYVQLMNLSFPEANGPILEALADTL